MARCASGLYRLQRNVGQGDAGIFQAVDGLAEKVFEFGNKRVKEHFEDLKGFLAHKKMDSLKEIEK